MRLLAFTVYDSKTEAYLRPFFDSTAASALRAFSDSVNDPQSGFYKHPADFTLFEIGCYDDSSGLLEAIPPHNLGCGIERKIEVDHGPLLTEVTSSG